MLLLYYVLIAESHYVMLLLQQYFQIQGQTISREPFQWSWEHWQACFFLAFVSISHSSYIFCCFPQLSNDYPPPQDIMSSDYYLMFIQYFLIQPLTNSLEPCLLEFVNSQQWVFCRLIALLLILKSLVTVAVVTSRSWKKSLVVKEEQDKATVINLQGYHI